MKTLRKTLKIEPQALRLLKLIAADTGETLYAIVERLARQELARTNPATAQKEPPWNPSTSRHAR